MQLSYMTCVIFCSLHINLMINSIRFIVACDSVLDDNELYYIMPNGQKFIITNAIFRFQFEPVSYQLGQIPRKLQTRNRAKVKNNIVTFALNEERIEISLSSSFFGIVCNFFSLLKCVYYFHFSTRAKNRDSSSIVSANCAG